MKFNSSSFRPKVAVEVKVTLTDGTALWGNFYRNPHDRVLDVLNDDRAFLPFADKDGAVSFITKSAIWKIVPLEQNIEHIGEVPRHIGKM